MTRIAERHVVIDVDSHITEPPDVWTARLDPKWGDLIPHVKDDPKSGRPRWYVGEKRLPGVAASALAGWSEFPPSYPPSLEEADPAAWQAKPRLARMDEYCIDAQLLYPNILGFQGALFISMGERELSTACVRAYNDFLTEFCEEDPRRLIPLMMLPYWDMDETLTEMARAHELGHKGIVFGANLEAVGLPGPTDHHWDPFYAKAQDFGLPVNFHIGLSQKTMEEQVKLQRNIVTNKELFVKESALMMLHNAGTIADLTLGGVCERFPELRFVSVESGASWLPFVLEALDWQYLNCGAKDESPGSLLPSEYFRRQIYGSFWFEQWMLKEAVTVLPDNLMFETDFPHPTSLSPGPASYAKRPDEVIEDMDGIAPEILEKVLHSTAARVYNLDI